MAYFLKTYDGISVGPSAAMNVCAAVKLAQKLGPGHTVVTILCDTGDRYLTKLYNKDWTIEKKLIPVKYKKGRESFTEFVIPLSQSNFTEMNPECDQFLYKNDPVKPNENISLRS